MALLGNWASLVAQTVKNPPAMQETWVRSLGLEDPLEKGRATHSSINECFTFIMSEAELTTPRLVFLPFPSLTQQTATWVSSTS